MKNGKIFFLLCFAFLFSACGGSSEPQEEQVAAVTEAAVSEFVETTAVTVEKALTSDVAPAQETTTDSAIAAFSYERSEEELGDQSGIHFFTFQRSTQTYTDEAGNKLLEETLTKPVFYAADQELDSWVTEIIDEKYRSDVIYGQDLLEYAKANLKEIGQQAFYTYSHHVTMGVGRHDDKIVSLLSLSSVYSGGEQPYSVQTAYNLDLEQKRVLTLEDIIIDNAAATLEKMVCTSVESRFSALGKDALFENYADIIARNFVYGNMTPYWYFNAEGLIIFFNQYTLGPNTSGVIRIQLGYDELEGVIQSEYFPKSYNGLATGISIEDEPIEGEWIYPVKFAEGETVYISIEGRAHCVQLSEVFFAEQVPVGENMLFSANRIDDSTTFAVTGNLLSDDQTYALEYSDQRGGPNIVYIKDCKIMLDVPG